MSDFIKKCYYKENDETWMIVYEVVRKDVVKIYRHYKLPSNSKILGNLHEGRFIESEFGRVALQLEVAGKTYHIYNPKYIMYYNDMTYVKRSRKVG